LLREHRLYQADWLVRRYGFDASEIFEVSPNLSPEFDPKTAWALRHRDQFPLDVHRASRRMLLRVPGLGHRSADRIIRARRHGRLRLDDLRRIGVNLTKSGPFLICAEPNPALALLDRQDLTGRYRRAPQQLGLFSA
jgi:predicted DNA-binding helix-hairpin-helix protein